MRHRTEGAKATLHGAAFARQRTDAPGSRFPASVSVTALHDAQRAITGVNKQMEALTGWTRDELIGAPFKNHFTNMERAEASIKLALVKKRVTNYELTVSASHGKETVVSFNATTFYDRGRRLPGVFVAARDITERKESGRNMIRFVDSKT